MLIIPTLQSLIANEKYASGMANLAYHTWLRHIHRIRAPQNSIDQAAWNMFCNEHEIARKATLIRSNFEKEMARRLP